MEFLCPSLTIEWMVIWVFLLEIAATSASQKTPATSQKAPATLERIRFSHQADIQHFLTIPMVTLADCVDQCKRQKRCSSINNKDLYKLCYLLEEGNRTVNIYSAENVHFGRKDEWNMTGFESSCSECKYNEVCQKQQAGSEKCKIQECGIPPHIANAQVLGNQYSTGSKVCYHCEDSTEYRDSCSECLSTGTWSSVSLACKWTTVFIAEAGINKSIFELWTADTLHPPQDYSEGQLKKTNRQNIYRHSSLNKGSFTSFWERKKRIKVSLYTGGTEMAYLVFNNTNPPSRTSWFSIKTLVESTWTDLTTETRFECFSVEGYIKKQEDRRFYIVKPFSGCENDRAWIMVKDSKRYNPCSFDEHEDIPAFLYSPHTTKSHFGADDYKLAEVMAIFVTE